MVGAFLHDNYIADPKARMRAANHYAREMRSAAGEALEVARAEGRAGTVSHRVGGFTFRSLLRKKRPPPEEVQRERPPPRALALRHARVADQAEVEENIDDALARALVSVDTSLVRHEGDQPRARRKAVLEADAARERELRAWMDAERGARSGPLSEIVTGDLQCGVCQPMERYCAGIEIEAYTLQTPAEKVLEAVECACKKRVAGVQTKVASYWETVHRRHEHASAPPLKPLPPGRDKPFARSACYIAGKCVEEDTALQIMPGRLSSVLRKAFAKGERCRRPYDQNMAFVCITSPTHERTLWFHIGCGNLNTGQFTFTPCEPEELVLAGLLDGQFLLKRIGRPVRMQIVDQLPLDHLWNVEMFTGVPTSTQKMTGFRPVALVQEMNPTAVFILFDPDAKKTNRLPITYPRLGGRVPIDHGGGVGGVLVCPNPELDDFWTSWVLSPSDDEEDDRRRRRRRQGRGGGDGGGGDGGGGRPPPSPKAPPPKAPPPKAPPPKAPPPKAPPLPLPPHPAPREDDAEPRHLEPAPVRAPPGTRNVVDPMSGRTFVELHPKNVFNGHSLTCETCLYTKNLGWVKGSPANGFANQQDAFARLLAWEAMCSGDPDEHKGVGGQLLCQIPP